MQKRSAAALVTSVAVTVFAGCGDASSGPAARDAAGRTSRGEASAQRRLTAAEELQVALAIRAFGDTLLNGSRYAETLRGVDSMIALCRKKPDAYYQFTHGGAVERLTMRQVVEDGANTLRRVEPDLAANLDRAADSRCE